MDPVRHRFQQVFEELLRRSPVRPVDELGDREFTRAVDANEQLELAFGSLNLGDIHVNGKRGLKAALWAEPLTGRLQLFERGREASSLR